VLNTPPRRSAAKARNGGFLRFPAKVLKVFLPQHLSTLAPSYHPGQPKEDEKVLKKLYVRARGTIAAGGHPSRIDDEHRRRKVADFAR